MDKQKAMAVVRLKHMLAMLHIISREETRYYLNGVFIEPHKDGGAVLTATDGHLLVTLRDPHAICVGPPQIWKFDVAHAAAIKAAAKDKKRRSLTGWDVFCRYQTEDAADHKVSRLAAATEETAEKASELKWDSAYCTPIAHEVAIDGTFPEYRRVIPDIREPRGGAVVSASLLGRISKFASDFSSSSNAAGIGVAVELQEGGGPGFFYVKSSDTFAEAIGVVMPMRGDRLHHLPIWLGDHIDRQDQGPAWYEAKLAEERALAKAERSAQKAA
jgi:hypothetical protein